MHQNLPVYHLVHFQSERSTLCAKNDEPFFDQNSPSLTVSPIDFNGESLSMLSRCFSYYTRSARSMRNSNRHDSPSTADIFDIYAATQLREDEAESVQSLPCKRDNALLHAYAVEQVALWLLSFSNSYYLTTMGGDQFLRRCSITSCTLISWTPTTTPRATVKVDQMEHMDAKQETLQFAVLSGCACAFSVNDTHTDTAK